LPQASNSLPKIGNERFHDSITQPSFCEFHQRMPSAR
jgi:hypothetical protein